MKIFYWSPHISHVATVSAVINSIKSVKNIPLEKLGVYYLMQSENGKLTIKNY